MSMWLLVGLGNPGAQYADNRHNIGFMVIDEIARRGRAAGDRFRGKFGAELGSADVAGSRAILLKPQEYMNLSGRAVQRAAAFYQVEPKDIVVVHDEIDLPLGTLRVKVGGGHAGHNGVRSLIADLGTADFVRVRCGVGRPAGRRQAAGFVLDDFAADEEEEKKILIAEAADAVHMIVARGITHAMNRYNVKRAEDTEN
jgi:peptidyl-tRNA hydrolase, PTH1 family